MPERTDLRSAGHLSSTAEWAAGVVCLLHLHTDMAPTVNKLISPVELELKFGVPNEAVESLLEEMRSSHAMTRRMIAICYDTPDDCLGARRISVWLRQEGAQWFQTARRATTDPSTHLEHSVPAALPRGRSVPKLDLSRHAGTAVGAAIHAALHCSRTDDSQDALIERFRIDMSRLWRMERVGTSNVELALDIGRIETGSGCAPVCEFKLQLKSGSVTDLCALASTHAVQHGLWLSTVSKAERGERLLRGRPTGPAVKAATPTVDFDAGKSGFSVAALRCCLAQILGNASEVGEGSADAEIVHQLRVGLRRMRTVLRASSGFSAATPPAWDAVFGRAFRALGTYRDIVTVVPTMLVEMKAAGVDWVRPPVLLAAPPSPEAVVRDPSFQRTLLAVLSFCHSPEPLSHGPHDAPKPLKKELRRQLEKLQVRLVRDTKKFAALSPIRQHAVRKRLKRLRYLGEFAQPLFAAKRVRRYVHGTRKAQDTLGVWNDDRVCLEAIRSGAEFDLGVRPALKWLEDRLDDDAGRAARSLRKAMKQPVFWR